MPTLQLACLPGTPPHTPLGECIASFSILGIRSLGLRLSVCVCVCVCVCVSQGGGLSKCRFWIFPKKAPFPFNYELNKPPRKHFSTKSFFLLTL